MTFQSQIRYPSCGFNTHAKYLYLQYKAGSARVWPTESTNTSPSRQPDFLLVNGN